MYTPPFVITSKAINLIAEISSLIERYAIRLEMQNGFLRKANRIKTIHSSLAIEGNNLSEAEVEDILNGKHIVAPLREIQEVKNAIRTYELYETLNPFDINDLRRAHGVMMEALTEDAGNFRRGGVGVYSEKGVVHIAPPAERVPTLMADLFEWLRSTDDHLLIRSCVFHYEFEFIHPFSDGNGRMGRLWQSLILGELHPLFAHLPVENMVYANQQNYYDAIQASTKNGESGPFIDFMLQEILNTLSRYKGENIEEVRDKIRDKIRDNFGITSAQIIEFVLTQPAITLDAIAEEMHCTRRTVEKHVKALREAGVLQRVGGNKNGHWEVNL